MKALNLKLGVIFLLTLTACGPVGRAHRWKGNSTSLGSSGLIVAGYGHTVPGIGSSTAPTADAVVARLKNGLQNNVSPSAGNFALALEQLRVNLPKVTDPLKATGFDQVELLAYAACSDLTAGQTPRMQSQYGVSKAATVPAQANALVAAGMKILDAHLAGLASESKATPKVKEALEGLVQKMNENKSNSTMAFMSVCIAANTAGSSMMGF